MALTPLDIHHKEFKTTRFGGYNEEEVDSFLDLVADEFERLIQENSDVLQRMEQMQQKLAEFEEMQSALQSALLTATKSAEMVKEQSRQESEAMITKAQDEADSLIRSSQDQARQINLSAQNERQKLERSFSRLKDIKKRYLQSIKELADANLAMVAEVEAAQEPQDPAEQAELDALAKTESETTATLPPPVESETVPSLPVVENVPPRVAEAATAPPPAPEPRPEPPQAKAPPASSPTHAPPPIRTEDAPVPPTAKDRDLTAPPIAQEGRDMRGPAPQAAAMSQAPPAAEPPEVAREAKRPSSNLVEDVLSVDADDEIYDVDDEGPREDASERSRKGGRKEKKEKHFFWE